MFNVVIAGNLYDTSNNLINGFYKLYFRHKELTTNTLTTADKQVVINLNDLAVLGNDGYVEDDEPIYLIVWQGNFDKTTVIREAYKRINFNNQNVILEAIVLDEHLTIEHSITTTQSDNVITITNNTITNSVVVEHTYYVYVKTDSILETGISNTEFKLLKVIKTTDIETVIVFGKKGVYKIISETLVDNLDVSTQQVKDVIISVCTDTLVTSNKYRIEWE
jgi:hypothetical protein